MNADLHGLLGKSSLDGVRRITLDCSVSDNVNSGVGGGIVSAGAIGCEVRIE